LWTAEVKAFGVAVRIEQVFTDCPLERTQRLTPGGSAIVTIRNPQDRWGYHFQPLPYFFSLIVPSALIHDGSLNQVDGEASMKAAFTAM
jgi:hypothetical protein